MKNFCLQMSRKAWLTTLLVICLSFPALAQKITVTGTVTDQYGDPVIGGSVVAQGNTTGTATDIDGNYAISVDANGTLVFSGVGYETQTIAVNGRTKIDVVLSENATMLNEVVAIGYGAVKKSDATGSVAVIKPDDVEAGIATSTQNLLVGASPGLTVTTNGGDPTGNANIRIRGGSSLNASNDPLIVIDGVPQSNQNNFGGTNALTMVNPQDIESITVLKDASATAIYGSRASNGVIIITTKKGASGKPKVNFAANWHVNTARKTLDMMNAAEFKTVVNKLYGDNESIQAMVYDADTNWQKELLRTSFSQDYALSISGAAKWLPYRVSASYTNNQGIIKESGMQRTTVGFNLSPKFFNGLLQINANANGTYINSKTGNTGALAAAIGFNPSAPVHVNYPTDGNSGKTAWNGYFNYLLPSGGSLVQAAINPVQQVMDQRHKVGEVYSSTGNLQIDYALHWLPELHFNLNLGYQVSKNNDRNFNEANSMDQWRNSTLTSMNAAGAGTKYLRWELQRNTLLDFYVNYKNQFDAIKSNLDVTAGYSWQRFTYFGHEQTYTSTFGYLTDAQGGIPYDPATGQYTLNVNYRSPRPGTKVPNSYHRWGNNLQLLSFFGRINYSFDDTYLLTFTLRDDASSRFSKDNRWGLFPAVALGWKIANLPVFENIRQDWNDFKLRLGWGQTGQQDIGSYFPYMPTYTSSFGLFYYPGPNGNGWIYPLYPNAYAEDITWETTTTWNVGVDLGFLNNRITATADWYLRRTTDLLAYTPVSILTTSDYMDRNIGSLRNVGVELTLNARVIDTKDFTWSTGINWSYNYSKITALTGDKATSQIQAATLPFGTGSGIQYHLVGEAPYSFYVYEQVYDNDGNPVEGQYVDQNGDGKITVDDKIVYHSRDPKYTFSWNNNFNYKNWDLGFTLRANIGNYVYNAPKYQYGRYNAVGGGYGLGNLMRDTYLFNSADDQLPLSSYFVENASFLRCDNISLGYTFDNLLKGDLNLRLFGVVQNPFVITKYKGRDPEVFGGIDNDPYPRPITVTFGVVANF